MDNEQHPLDEKAWKDHWESVREFNEEQSRPPAEEERKPLTRWQKSAGFRSSPMVTAVSFAALGLILVAYYLIRFGLGNPVARTALLFGFCVGLVYSLLNKWIYRRDMQTYVNSDLGLPYAEGCGAIALRMFVSMALMGEAIHSGNSVHMVLLEVGAFMSTLILLYPEHKAVHEAVKAKLAEMENESHGEEVS